MCAMANDASLSQLKPTEPQRVYDLAKAAGVDVRNWGKFSLGQARAAANPKYCYKWAFVESKKVVVCNLWFDDMRIDDRLISQVQNYRALALSFGSSPKEIVWKRRALEVDEAIRTAYTCQLPVRVVVISGRRRSRNDPEAKASQVQMRKLDAEVWAVTLYEFGTGAWTLTRGAKPDEAAQAADDVELLGFEGAARWLFVKHRQRERRMRAEKLARARQKNDGRLICEVPNCGFEFGATYGQLGDGYTHVHHRAPLSQAPEEGRSVSLNDLAIVCANCHAMIHVGGQCRPLEGLISATN